MVRGGKRPGAGAPKKPPLLKKIPLSVKISRWVIEELRRQGLQIGPSLEEAAVKVFKLRKPKDGGK